MIKILKKVMLSIITISIALVGTFVIDLNKKENIIKAETTTSKQVIGTYITMILASLGIRLNSTISDIGEFVYDNFNTVMGALSLATTAQSFYDDTSVNYDDTTSTLTLTALQYQQISDYAQYLIDNNNVAVGTNTTIGNTQIQMYSEVSASSPLVVFGNNWGIRINQGIPGRVVALKETNNSTIYRIYVFNQYQFGYVFNTLPNSYSYTNTYLREQDKYFAVTNVDNSDILIPYAVNSQYDSSTIAYQYAYGDLTLDDVPVYADGQATLDDLIGAQTESDVTIDYTGLKEGEETLTLADLLDKVNQMILNNSYAQDYPEAEIVEKTIVIPNAENILLPNILDLNNLPQIVEPQCENLGSCLIEGVQSVSNHLQQMYNSNASLGNFVSVSLAVAFAFFVLFGGI